MNICGECWETLKVVPNLINIPYRNISKINVECDECGEMTSTPRLIEVSNRDIEKDSLCQ